jgi:hypothetical protein
VGWEACLKPPPEDHCLEWIPDVLITCHLRSHANWHMLSKQNNLYIGYHSESPIISCYPRNRSSIITGSVRSLRLKPNSQWKLSSIPVHVRIVWNRSLSLVKVMCQVLSMQSFTNVGILMQYLSCVGFGCITLQTYCVELEYQTRFLYFSLPVCIFHIGSTKTERSTFLISNML